MRIFAFFALLACFGSGAAVDIILPKPGNPDTPSNTYIIQLINEAVQAVGDSANITYSADRMNQKRAMHSLEQDVLINLSWFTQTPARDQKLQAIPFPIYKGSHGLRLFIIHKDQAHKFAKVKTLPDLIPLVGLQKSSWSDYDVLIANGLTINGSLSYQSMYKAIEEGLGDYFPRSAMTISSELRNNNKQGKLLIEPRLALKYDNYYYLYVNKNNQALYKTLTTGLDILVTQGRYEVLFQRYFANRFKGLNIHQRLIFELALPD